TPVGDPIEFEALLEAFGGVDAPLGTCALGSVKANLGHPTTAAGVVGLIKVALMLSHETLVPLANFDGRINPSIDIGNSPFFIPTVATPWSRADYPRRAAVSSFGFCGTNAHAIVEEAPEAPRSYASLPPREAEILLLSAKTASALTSQIHNLVPTITPETNSKQVAQAAFTLAFGRTGFDQRSFGIWSGTDTVPFSEPLAKPKKPRPLLFLFPGQGTQYLGMGQALSRQEPAFRNALEEIAAEIRPAIGCDIRDVMWGTSHQGALDDTRYTQPALFAIELALASYWETLGLVADGLVGHSVGEYPAAVLAGVMTRAQAARLVCRRAELMASAQPGEMLAVRASKAVLASLLPSGIEIAVINGPEVFVVGGSSGQIAEAQAILGSAGYQSKRLNTSHAFHTSAMAEAARQFERDVGETLLLPPQRPIISTVTGTVLKDTEACDPAYWSRQILQPVNYHGAINHVWHQGAATILEVGPGASLSRLASQSRQSRDSQTAFASLRSEGGMECYGLAEATGKLWTLGYDINWDVYFEDRIQERVPLPTYPFERTRYWLDPVMQERATVSSPISAQRSMVSVFAEAASDDLPLSTASIIEDIRDFFKIAGAEFSTVPENSSFFDEGVDSLLLTQIIFMIQECYGVKVTFRDINQSLSTLGALARYIEAEVGTADNPTVAVAKTDNGSRLGPNRKQRAMLTRMEENALGWQIDLARATVHFEQGLDVDRLSRALKQLAERHEALNVKLSADRQSWAGCGQTPRLILGGDRNVADIDWLNPFADADSPLWSATLNTNASGHRLDIVASGLICDGWSLDLMLEDLASLYSGRPLGRTDSLATIEEADIRLLPSSRLDEATHETLVFSSTALRALREEAKSEKCSVFTVLLAKVFLAMRDVCPSGKLGLYLAAAGQATRNLPRLVTNCTDAFPITVNPERSCLLNSITVSLGEQLARIRDRPESIVVEESAPITLRGIPLVGLFVHVKALSGNAQKFEGVESEYQLHPAPVLEADFQITMFERAESLELTFSRKRYLTVGDELRALLDALVHQLADAVPLEGTLVSA
ncbi:MAG: acyltransferase domain-containing protein, partial [Sphingopyxis sp.]|nr:acyltransferase domain-containing protein [Sphingopyxis sp.]